VSRYAGSSSQQQGAIVESGNRCRAWRQWGRAAAIGAALAAAAGGGGGAGADNGVVFLVIDEDSLDNGLRYVGHPDAAPQPGRQNILPATTRTFTDTDVNDRHASFTQRDILPFFNQNVGKTIAVVTGEVGDEGWLAPNCVPSKWVTGSSNSCLAEGSPSFADGLARYLAGTVRQNRLDGIRDVRPLRARGLAMLEGQTACAVVYDGDVSVNFRSSAPHQIGNLQGATLGVVAFTVVAGGVNRMHGFSSSTLPEVQIRIEPAARCAGQLALFRTAPIPRSSSGPHDVDPASTGDDGGYILPQPDPPIGNQAPTIVSAAVTSGNLLESYRYPVVATDPNNDALQYSLTTAPIGMTIDRASGVIDWIPPGTGTLDVGVRVDDGRGGSATQSFVVTVGVPPNRPPVLQPAAPRTVAAGELVRLPLVADDPDQGDVLTFALVSGPQGASLVDQFVEWRPTAAQSGTHVLTARVEDLAGAADSGSFAVEVVTTNVPPTLEPQADATIAPGAMFVRLVTAQDPDPADTLTFALQSGPQGLTLSPGGQIAWTPSLAELGDHLVRLSVTDSAGHSDAAMFTITVAVSAALGQPVANDDRYAVRGGTSLAVPAIGVLGNDTDPAGQPLTAHIVSGAARGTVDLNADGSFSYTPFVPPLDSTRPVMAFELRRPTVPVTGVENGPFVADLNRDGRPEIVYAAVGTFSDRRLDSVHGDGSVRFSVDVFGPVVTERVATGGEEFALGDLDGDGFVEIVAVAETRQHLIAFNHDGTRRWVSDNVVGTAGNGVVVTNSTPGSFNEPVIADLDGDGVPEIVIRHLASGPAPNTTREDYASAYSNDGRLLWHCRGAAGDSSATGNVLVVDVDLDGRPEVLFGNDVCDRQGNLTRSTPFPSGRLFQFISVASLDDDPFAEVVNLVIAAGFRLQVYHHTGQLMWDLLVPGSGAAGRPVIADVDGDGRPEILVARADHLVVMNRDGTVHRMIDVPGGDAGTPTVFDLNGDGRPEIIYHAGHGPFDNLDPGDPQSGALLIFDGPTGALLHEMEADRHGADEHMGVIVADVDGDGSASIVTRSWTENFVTVRVFKAASGTWAQTRPVWNQAGYHITNVNDDGAIPPVPLANWLVPGLNNFGVNVPLPEARTGSRDSFTYQVFNGALLSNVATVHLDLLPPNTAPRILSQAPAAATPDVEYVYAVRAADPDLGEVLAFSLPLAPAGMTIDGLTGLLRWTPTAAQMGQAIAVVRVTDSQGESDSQQIIIDVGEPVTVPVVAGLTLAEARAALEAAGLVSGPETLSPSGSVPAGTVIGQEPLGGATVARGSSVALAVSSGPAPIVVPHVVGKREGNARTQLTLAGFGVVVAKAFSATVPSGEVIAQTPGGGSLVAPGQVQITVSAGTGLALRLDRTLTPANQAIPFALVSYDLAGVESPAGATFEIVATRAPFAGPLPAIDTGAITPALSTRGSFRVIATETTTGRQAFADFAVTYARTNAPSMMDDYAQLTEAMGDIDDLLRRGAAAIAANDTALMRSLLDQMVQRWRQVDTGALSFDVPLALEAGFTPQPSGLPGLGLTPTTDDLLAFQVLKDAAADLQAWTDGLRAPATSMAALGALADRFATRAARLRGLTLTEWGAIRAQSTMALIVSRRIPALYTALMDELALVVASGGGGVDEAEEQASGPFAGESESTLNEQLTAIATAYVVEKMQEHFSQTYVSAKQFTTDVLGQAAWGAGAIALAQHVRGFVQGQDITAVVSGASLSFRVFDSPGSMIEGPFDVDNPEMNIVVLIGPQIAGPLTESIDQFRALMQYGQPADPNGGARSVDEIVAQLKSFVQELGALRDTISGAAAVVGNALQTPGEALRGCVFSSAATCHGLVFPDGFKSVYEYTAPQGFGCFTGLPLPIVFLVYNATSGTMYFEAPPFFPTPAGGGTTPRCGG
jgi:hypothetical protein